MYRQALMNGKSRYRIQCPDCGRGVLVEGTGPRYDMECRVQSRWESAVAGFGDFDEELDIL
jgi:ribosomal protein S27E